ncbi:MAG TPA: crossover junction endodeoxyribonuclease RuvC [Spongiibacteraceae bacterium]|jgi:crossover junction endodeoxyribonuclease RuvC|nr:crossover junction endodeoxyribonuclease RuvC [Spongiibacteraceae bacterium]HUH38957.1 crossover junction endodeoxyribonuclease RuvC [Spongiibacteraceae bacterium]
MALILGIDPGSRKTGFGIVNADGNRHEYVASGVIRLPDGPLPERLRIIFDSISEIVHRYSPQFVAVEEVFMAKSAGSALKLGQARGAAVVACASNGLDVAEYTARQVKQAVVGTGAADKVQVQHMVRILLRLPEAPQEDAADALACALCHAHTRQGMVNMIGLKQPPRGRMRRGRLA